MRKDDGSKMQKWTLKLRETHPAAAQCRLRRAKGHYELVGTLSDGRRIAKRLSGAEDEHEALEKAKDLTDQMMSGIASTRMLPQGMVARAERLALARIDLIEVRSATKAYHNRITKECASWLAERGLLVSQATLVNFYKEAPRTSRKRRERIEAARHLAKASGISLEVMKADQYVEPAPPERKRFSEARLLRYLDVEVEALPEAMRWVIRAVACTGIRAGETLSLKIPKGEVEMGTPLHGWSSKRNRKGITTPTLRNRWMEWDLSNPPQAIRDLQVSHREPPSQEELDAIHRFTNQIGHELRRKCSKGAAKALSFRSLRHHATTRLYENRNLDEVLIAEALFTSTAQLSKTYSQLYRNRTAELIAEAFTNQEPEQFQALSPERAQRLTELRRNKKPQKTQLEIIEERMRQAMDDADTED